jgi:outer membrane immunogenic protein
MQLINFRALNQINKTKQKQKPMKKSILIITLIITASLYVSAQDNNFGAGLAYGSDIKRPAIFGTYQYFVNDKLAIVPSLVFYFPKSSSYTSATFDPITFAPVSYKAKTSYFYWELNGDVNYYFTDSDVKFYGIGGLNLTTGHYNVKYTPETAYLQSVGSSNSELGLNLGVGADFSISGNATPFFQLKYIVGNFDQLVVMLGVRFKK